MGMIGNSLAQGLISGANIQDGSVDTVDIKDAAVTPAKVAASSDFTFNGVKIGKGAGAVSTNTAVGASALSGASQTGAYNTAIGWQALVANTTGQLNSALGVSALQANTTGTDNSAFGVGSLQSNTTGSYNTAYGRQSLFNTTTAGGNTAVGYQAAFSNSTGASNVYLGQQAGYSATGTGNVFVGSGAGYYVTSGAKNTIIGRYDGNQGGLDIRTLSNWIVLSDGDGNPKYTNNGNFYGFNTVTAKGNNYFSFNCQQQGFIIWNGVNSNYNELGVWDGASDTLKAVVKAEGGVAKFGSRTNSPVGIQVNDAEVARFDTSGNLYFNPGSRSGGENARLTIRNDTTSIDIRNFMRFNNRVYGTTNHIVGGIVFSAYRDVRDPCDIAAITGFRNSAAGGLSSDGYLQFRAGGGNSIEVDGVLPGVVAEMYGSGDFRIFGSNATKASGTAWINPSDVRLKDDIQDYTKGLDELMQIRVRTWLYNGKGGTVAGMKGLGVLADEAMLVLPDTVNTYSAKLDEEDEEAADIKNFDASEVTWLLVKSMQQLKADFDAYKAAHP